MEKINFSNNVEMVRAAREVFTDDYELAMTDETCVYRMPDQPEVRCLMGRLLFGHIPESHPFWESKESIEDAFRSFPSFQEKFPWMDLNIARKIQHHHDVRAGICYNLVSWDDLEKMAEAADKENS